MGQTDAMDFGLEAYRAACRLRETMVHRIRLMIVGYAGAGKTSVLKTLLDEPFDEHEKTTNGIDADRNCSSVKISTAVKWEKGENYK